ncbi:hypothetical protein GYMLUDRAFT_251082 [Collybiopsis luxurians FD-317 M1]|uniref:Unplaced genomic scaffold GYMLUscaffold_92, whole genome shotgun sequence n=1 Tax=Collybiopsis luxurians FD-317 M1 TaxID=944289 RepID=A0A0D0AQI7_9AGAR|nr:hypothetical protein GYMLUDRAFT_251082 [Collybiopsis luxurians FD-317 M1]
MKDRRENTPDPRSFKAATNFTVEEPKANTHCDTGDFPSQNAPSIPEVVHQEDTALYAKLKDLYDLRLLKETPRGPRDDGMPSQNQSTIQGGRRTPSPQRPSCHCNNLACPLQTNLLYIATSGPPVLNVPHTIVTTAHALSKPIYFTGSQADPQSSISLKPSQQLSTS